MVMTEKTEEQRDMEAKEKLHAMLVEKVGKEDAGRTIGYVEAYHKTSIDVNDRYGLLVRYMMAHGSRDDIPDYDTFMLDVIKGRYSPEFWSAADRWRGADEAKRVVDIMFCRDRYSDLKEELAKAGKAVSEEGDAAEKGVAEEDGDGGADC